MTRDTRKAAGILFLHAESRCVLLVKRASWLPTFPETWCIPGGSVEPGEGVWEGAAREALEEVGFGCDLDQRWPLFVVGNYTTFVVLVSEKFKPLLNEEHTDHVWLGLEHLNPLAHRMHPGFVEMLKLWKSR